MKKAMYLSLAFIAMATVAALQAQPAVNQGGQHLSGAWMGVYLPLGRAPQKYLATFGTDGDMISSSPTVALRPGGTQLLSAGHGSWIRTGNGKFAATTVNMHSDPADATTGFSVTKISFDWNDAVIELVGQFKTDVYL